MIVHFKFYSTIREIVGRETLKLRLRRGATVETVLERLFTTYGKELKKRLSKRENWVIMLNDKNITFSNGLETSLNDGDKISILSPLSGG